MPNYEGNLDGERNVGKCGATVIKNLQLFPLEKRTLPYDIYFDNLFISQHKLREFQCTGTGMIRENRCKKCPLVSVASMKKKSRGSVDYVTDNKNNSMLCRWMDNSVVTIATTRQVSQASMLVKRFLQKRKEKT